MGKIAFAVLLAIVYVNSIYGINISNNYNKNKNNIVYQYSNSQDDTIYKYGVYEIDKRKYIYNLGTNVQGYLDSKEWNEYFRLEFINSYEKYMAALKENRLSTTDFGSIIDSKGELGNVDEDDYWYDNKGNRITGAEYRALSVRKQKKYRTFYANREIATYLNEIAKAIVNRR